MGLLSKPTRACPKYSLRSAYTAGLTLAVAWHSLVSLLCAGMLCWCTLYTLSCDCFHFACLESRNPHRTEATLLDFFKLLEAYRDGLVNYALYCHAFHSGISQYLEHDKLVSSRFESLLFLLQQFETNAKIVRLCKPLCLVAWSKQSQRKGLTTMCMIFCGILTRQSPPARPTVSA